MEKFEMIKADLEIQIGEHVQTQTANKNRLSDIQTHNTFLEDLANSKD